MSARKQRASGRGHVIGREGFADREEESGTEKTKPKVSESIFRQIRAALS
jgi:hypothetical protein